MSNKSIKIFKNYNLQGFHAVPVKLKMLLDRLFSLLNPEEITALLRGFGWTIQDYQRGYILKVFFISSQFDIEYGVRI